MKLNEKSHVFLPQKKEIAVDEICFAAHCDDAEIIALHAIYGCKKSRRFGAVIAADCGEERRREQQKAAKKGGYGLLIFLNRPSLELKENPDYMTAGDFFEILKKYKPKKVYTHNIFDKHATHVSTAIKLIEAIRLMPQSQRPEFLYGGEVWRGLDWICDKDKIVSDLSVSSKFGKKLLGLFKSQNKAGRRYDLGADGRRRANAAFYDMYDTHSIAFCAYGIDMTPLIRSDKMSIREFAEKYLNAFSSEVLEKLGSMDAI